MRLIGFTLTAILISVSTAATSDEMPASGPSQLPIPGTWQGEERCMVRGGEQILPATRLNITIRANEIFNAYGPRGRSNSMFAEHDPAIGLTSEKPDFVRNLMGTKLLSQEGNELLEMLARVLESRPEGITTYVLQPSDSLVSGRMFCHAAEKWCHFEAIKRVPIGTETYEVQGGDLMRDFGGRLIRVGYAYDRFSCAPDVCVYVCEAQLETE